MFKFGLIGVGGRGGHLARTMMQDEKKRGDIVALCDINPYMMDTYEKYVEQFLGHKVNKKYTDYKELIADPKVDVVVIGTPDQFHHEMALAAFEAKKHVFLEKPVGINLDQMMDIVNAARKAQKESGCILEIGYVLRYSPFYEKIKNIIEKGMIGKINFAQMLEQYYGGAAVFFRNWWRLRKNVGGIMIQKICHDLDLAYWLFGKPKTVVAVESNMEFKPGNWDSDATYCYECKNHCPYFMNRNEKTNHIDYCLYNTDKTGADIADNAQVLVQYENGLTLNLGMNFLSSVGQAGRSIRICGSKADITGDLEEQLLRVDPRHDFSRLKTFHYATMVSGAGGHGGGDDVQMIRFLDALEEGRESKAGIESAYWSSILVMGAQLSADERRLVKIEKLTDKYPFPK